MTADQLRKSILQQAIQGKLVPQDPNDEPASVLLERIREEKSRLVEEKKIKKEKNPSVIFRGEDNSYYEKFTLSGEVKCIDEEIPFEIPNGWEWCRLSCLTSFLGDGIHGTPEYDDAGDIYFVNGNNLNDGIITIKDDTKRVNSTEAVKYKRTLTDSTVLVSINGTLGKVAFYNNEKIILGKSACYFNLLGCVNKFYIKCLIETEYFSEYAKKVATGTTIKNVPLAGMRNFLIPLPSLSEQSRIVDIVNELNTKVSRYNHIQSELDSLNRSIYDKFKKSVLQYAIEGKLVPQDEAEGTAEELLLQIQAEKQKLYEENKLKKKDLEHSTIFKGEDNKYYEKIGKNVTCIDEEIPFDIPKNWRWCRLGDITIVIGGYAFSSEDIKGEIGVRVIRISDFNEKGWVNNKVVRYKGKEKLIQYEVKINDLLLAMTGGTVGKSFLVDYLQEKMFLNQRVASIRSINTLPKYLNILLKAPLTLDIINSIKNSTNDNISMKDINNFLIPLPPLAEQQRIVESIDAIFRCIEKN